MVFFDRTKSALLLAMKIASITPANVEKRAKKTKAATKVALSLMKPKAGDQRSTPAMKITATARATIPLRVKQEFIISTGFSALGRKRMRANPRPTLLIRANRPIADIMAAPQPRSASV